MTDKERDRLQSAPKGGSAFLHIVGVHFPLVHFLIQIRAAGEFPAARLHQKKLRI